MLRLVAQQLRGRSALGRSLCTGDQTAQAAARLHAALAPHVSLEDAALLVQHQPGLGASDEAAAAAAARRAALTRVLPSFMSVYGAPVAAAMLAAGSPWSLHGSPAPPGAPSPALLCHLAQPHRPVADGEVVGDIPTTGVPWGADDDELRREEPYSDEEEEEVEEEDETAFEAVMDGTAKSSLGTSEVPQQRGPPRGGAPRGSPPLKRAVKAKTKRRHSKKPKA